RQEGYPIRTPAQRADERAPHAILTHAAYRRRIAVLASERLSRARGATGRDHTGRTRSGYAAVKFLRTSAAWLGAFALLGNLATASAQTTARDLVQRVPEFGRALASVEDSTAIVVNPANLAFMRGGELRWTGLFLNKDSEVPYSGHAIGLAVPIPFIDIAAGVRLDLLNPPPGVNDIALQNYQWLSWALAIPMGRSSALGATLEYSYSDGALADDLTAVSVGYTSRWTNWLGLAIVGHNLNRPRNRFFEFQPRWEAGVAIRPLSSRTLEVAFEGAYLKDDDVW